jgi:hypothetical protein
LCKIPITAILLNPFVPILAHLSSLITQDPMAAEFSNGLVLAMGRRMASTDTGHIGLAPGNARVGDSIALLKGAWVPIVLRPKGANWEVAGETYVHGLMNGERWNENLCERFWLQ